MNVSLYQVIRIVVRSDSDPARQVLFANLMQSRLSVRLAYGLHERLDGTLASALLVSCYGLAPFLGIVPSRDRRARVLVVAAHANARRQVARVISWIGPAVARQCDWVVADENSNVHLPVLKLGIPTVAVRNLGLYPESRSDLYGFAASGILFPPVRSIRDVRAEALVAFFSDR